MTKKFYLETFKSVLGRSIFHYYAFYFFRDCGKELVEVITYYK